MTSKRGMAGVWMRAGVWRAVVIAGVLASGVTARAQDVLGIVREAVTTELREDAEDHSQWKYKDDERDKGSVSIVVQTAQGDVKRLIAVQGRPLNGAEAAAEQARIEATIHDTSKMEKRRKDSQADDKSARELLQMLPEAFVWKLVGTTATDYRLEFAPNPGFRPPDMQSRVLGAMSGELVVNRSQHRIATISGRLMQDVTIGFGLLGRLKAGGTFRVERREVRPGLWQITETHVHIDGKALMFKSIGQQQDEVQTDFSPVPKSTTLEQAVEMSRSI